MSKKLMTIVEQRQKIQRAAFWNKEKFPMSNLENLLEHRSKLAKLLLKNASIEAKEEYDYTNGVIKDLLSL